MTKRTHPLIGGTLVGFVPNVPQEPTRRHGKHRKAAPKSWRVRCDGCGERSEWQTGELAAQSWTASHRCPK